MATGGWRKRPKSAQSRLWGPLLQPALVGAPALLSVPTTSELSLTRREVFCFRETKTRLNILGSGDRLSCSVLADERCVERGGGSCSGGGHWGTSWAADRGGASHSAAPGSQESVGGGWSGCPALRPCGLCARSKLGIVCPSLKSPSHWLCLVVSTPSFR